MELTTVALRLGWRVPSLGPLLMLVEYTNYIANNKPRYLAGLDVVKRVELFQQNHFPHFSKVLRRPIYEVSTLLGHSSVTTTEPHYAPLLTTEIDDFVL